jgi:protein ImuB
LHKDQLKRSKILSPAAIGECFLQFTPRLQWREDESGILYFLDIASTSHLFQGEGALLKRVLGLARELGLRVQGSAIADTPAGAQAFSQGQIPGCAEGEELAYLRQLPLQLLAQLEGLKPWARSTSIENLITFLLTLGFKTAGDLAHFTLASFQERWGETGEILWQRLNGKDQQVISPLIPVEPLSDYTHLDFPISLVSLLLHQSQKSLDFLFARLAGRRLFARRLVLNLRCEYNSSGNAAHRIEIEPNTPSRDQDLFITLIEKRLSELNLENPIRDFEIEIVPCPEKIQQFDFFEPRNSEHNKMQTLFSLLTQSSLKPGFYQIQNAIEPERGWTIVAEPKKEIADANQPVTKGIKRLNRKSKLEESPFNANSIALKPAYGQAVMSAPRPTRLLVKPLPLSLEELQSMKILSHNPVERLESGWWDDGRAGPLRRDYYFAISGDGQCLWIYQDLLNSEYFLHGYFD